MVRKLVERPGISTHTSRPVQMLGEAQVSGGKKVLGKGRSRGWWPEKAQGG